MLFLVVYRVLGFSEELMEKKAKRIKYLVFVGSLGEDIN